MINLSFLVSLFILILLTVFITYLSGKSTNRCFKDFSKYPVTVITKNKAIWGDFYPESTGFYIRYKKPKKEKNFKELSYLFYKQEFGDVLALIREVGELDDTQKEKREKEIRKIHNPTVIGRLKRYIYNVIIIAADVIKEALSITFGRALNKIPKSIPSQKGYASKISQLLVPSSSYDGLLEKLIGKKVILEIKEGERYKEHPGIFKEYTKDFLEVLDVEYKYTMNVKIFQGKEVEFKNILFYLDEKGLTIKNKANSKIDILHINQKEQNITIESGKEKRIELDHGEFIRIGLQITVYGDIIIPRTVGIIRHEAE